MDIASLSILVGLLHSSGVNFYESVPLTLRWSVGILGAAPAETEDTVQVHYPNEKNVEGTSVPILDCFDVETGGAVQSSAVLILSQRHPAVWTHVFHDLQRKPNSEKVQV